jgi:hypothetical protein
MSQQLAAQGQMPLAMAVGEQAEVADALKSGRQSVEEKAPDELLGRERHDAGFVLVFVAVVLPLESDLAIAHRQEPLVGNGDPVRIAADVFQRLLGASEGRLGT